MAAIRIIASEVALHVDIKATLSVLMKHDFLSGSTGHAKHVASAEFRLVDRHHETTLSWVISETAPIWGSLGAGRKWRSPTGAVAASVRCGIGSWGLRVWQITSWGRRPPAGRRANVT